MKPIAFLLLLCTSHFGICQEFGVRENGLIYSERTVGQLKHIVDSLNLKFKRCELHKTYYSTVQGKGHFVGVEENVKGALADIRKGIGFAAFLRKYPKATVVKELLVVQHTYQGDEGTKTVEYAAVKSGRRSLSVEPDEKEASPREGWIYQHHKKSSYTRESVEAFFVVEPFAAKPVAEPFARLIQYSNCLIDTSTQVYLEGAKRQSWTEEAKTPALTAFQSQVAKLTNLPAYQNEEQYDSAMAVWYKTRFALLDSIARTTDFQNALQRAVEESLKTGASNDEFEVYVARYKSPATALQLKRSRRVVGMCSQDESPRLHALNIAKLSAEAVRWEVFLRAHLDIMNDRFERASDGSYAWARRQTYIRELEVLDIDVESLLLGICFRISNPSQNHYFGDVGRIGRALAESASPQRIENAILSLIKNSALDDYNRAVFYFLLTHYAAHVADKSRQNELKALVQEARRSLPDYIAVHMAK